MIPTEKAKELVELMYDRIDAHTESEFEIAGKKEAAKQCALVAVEEIINELNDAFQGFVSDKRASYWQQVKAEIEKAKVSQISG